MAAEKDAERNGGGTVRQRFEARLLKPRGKHAAEACWAYRGSHTHGVGSFRVCSDVTWPAPRVAYALAFGPWVPSMQLEHSCRRKWCCNPAHLYTRPVRAVTRTRRQYTAQRKRELIRFCDPTALGVEETARTTNTPLATLERWLREEKRRAMNGHAHEGVPHA